MIKATPEKLAALADVLATIRTLDALGSYGTIPPPGVVTELTTLKNEMGQALAKELENPHG